MFGRTLRKLFFFFFLRQNLVNLRTSTYIFKRSGKYQFCGLRHGYKNLRSVAGKITFSVICGNTFDEYLDENNGESDNDDGDEYLPKVSTYHKKFYTLNNWINVKLYRTCKLFIQSEEIVFWTVCRPLFWPSISLLIKPFPLAYSSLVLKLLMAKSSERMPLSYRYIFQRRTLIFQKSLFYVLQGKALIKVMKNNFYFVLKALSVLNIFTFLSSFFWLFTLHFYSRTLHSYIFVPLLFADGLIRLISKFKTSQTEKQLITTHILSNISRSKSNQTTKFGQSI